MKSADFVTSEVFKLLELGGIKEIAKEEAHVISPLSVMDNGHKLRLNLGLSFMNKFLSVPKFHYDDIRTLKDLFQKGDFSFKFDIKSGYHRLDINEADQKFLVFSWEINGVARYFVLVFGSATAPFSFTKVVKVLIKHWRAQGICIFGFVDDVFGGAGTFERTKSLSDIVKNDLFLSGFIYNERKSFWEPRQEGEHLGFYVNFKDGTFSLTQKRIEKFRALLDFIMESLFLTARLVARLVGAVISVGLGIGPMGGLRTRMLYSDISKASL